MKRQYVRAALGLALVAVALALGCSNSNDGGTNPYTKLSGNPNDPVYKLIRSQMKFSVGYSQGMLHDIFLMLPEIDSMFAKPTTDTLRTFKNVTYHSTSQYWVSQYVDTTIDTNRTPVDTSYAYYADSVQFLHGATAVQFPDSFELTSIKIGSRQSLSSEASLDSISISLQVTMSGQPGAIARRGNVIIAGTGFMAGYYNGNSTVGPDTACAVSLAFNTKFSSLSLNINDVFYGTLCPTSGLVKNTGYLIADCHAPSDSLDYQKQWISTTTFDGQSIKFTIEDPSTRWVYEAPCDYIRAPSLHSEPHALVDEQSAQ